MWATLRLTPYGGLGNSVGRFKERWSSQSVFIRNTFWCCLTCVAGGHALLPTAPAWQGADKEGARGRAARVRGALRVLRRLVRARGKGRPPNISFRADALAECRRCCPSRGCSADSGCEPLTVWHQQSMPRVGRDPKRPCDAPQDCKHTTAPFAAHATLRPPSRQLPCWLPASYHCHQAGSSGCCCGLRPAGACTKLKIWPAATGSGPLYNS